MVVLEVVAQPPHPERGRSLGSSLSRGFFFVPIASLMFDSWVFMRQKMAENSEIRRYRETETLKLSSVPL